MNRLCAAASAVSMILGSAPPASAHPAGTTLSVGVVADPCMNVPKPPRLVTEFLARLVQAQAAGRRLPTPTPEGDAEYAAWQKQLLLIDFPGLCRYAAANETLPPASPQRLVFMGDSITEAWKEDRPQFFTGDRVDRGISGQTTSQMLGRFTQDVVRLHPATVHILAGTNDIAGNTGPTSLDAIENNIASMADIARRHGIRVVLGTLLPTRRYNWRPQIDPVPSITALNDWIRRYARGEHMTLVDYNVALDDGRHGLAAADSADGVHPTSAAYARMEALLTRELIAPAP